MMQHIDTRRAQRIATEAGLQPARVRGTDVLQFTRRAGARFEVLGWTEFERGLAERGLRLYESGGWLKIMK